MCVGKSLLPFYASRIQRDIEPCILGIVEKNFVVSRIEYGFL